MARSTAGTAKAANASLLASPRQPDFRQERARRSYEGLVVAAAALFSSSGYDNVGTPDIAEAAGMSVGTFYRYFVDKHAIYLEIARRSLRTAYADTIARLTPEAFIGRARADTIAETVAILFEHVLRDPGLWASFGEMALRDAAVGELHRNYDQLSCERLAGLITAVCPRAVVPDPAATAYVLYGSAKYCAAGLAGHGGKAPIAAERARAALATVIERALFPA